ncbi:uncharacterized protein [Miscanthus floridulus]|uniref:uncharacterized protein n=1 Tax=Miscanthus floridulus TaxID=154761 RepID=UPI003459F468
MLADLLQEKIEDIGKNNVVQVVTDNGANYKAAGKILMDRIPTLFWSPYAAHCLDLMLKEIGNLKAFKKPIARQQRLDLPPDIEEFVKEQGCLEELVLEDCLRASVPLLIVLRVVDDDEKPAMPEDTTLMNHAKERIKPSFNISTKQGLLKRTMDIIEKRWVNQMEHPLYGAALYLNLGKFYPLVKANVDATVGQLRGCFIEVLGRMIPDVETQMKINRQAIEYEEQRGDAFSNKMLIGGILIVAEPLNSKDLLSMHTKKRNRLLHKRLNDIVFVSYNRKMRTRVQLMREKTGKKYDPLVIEEFDWDNEWADSLHVPIPGARGSDAINELTWQHVDEATDGEEEDEVEDPHDDVEVSECEEDGNVPATEEDKAADPDEFDDGF